MDEEMKAVTIDLFGRMLLLGRRLDYIVGRKLAKDDLTTKQFLTLAAIESLFEHPPSISNVGEVLLASRQNVKMIASQLEKRGFLRIERDPEDRRVLRLHVTDRNREYWESRAEEHQTFILRLFKTLSEDEMLTYADLVDRMLRSVEALVKEDR
jgi:DNA-binding MarR family transcriptional regulator